MVSFLVHVYESSSQSLPKYVDNEFRRYLAVVCMHTALLARSARRAATSCSCPSRASSAGSVRVQHSAHVWLQRFS